MGYTAVTLIPDTSDNSEAAEGEGSRPPRRKTRARFLKWLFVAVPVIGLVELVAHAFQTLPVATEQDWIAARQAVTQRVKPDDLVVIAPGWLDPVGRMQLGDALMTEERVARADESRFPRAVELALGGSRTASLKAWAVTEEERVGPFTVRTLGNPAQEKVIDDLVAHEKQLVAVQVVGGKEQPCARRQTGAATGPLGFGPAAPAERLHCAQGAWVGATILADLDYAPRRCLFAPPPGGQGVLEIRFGDVRFGKKLQGHHALYVEAERDRKGTPVRIEFEHEGQMLGAAVHEDGQGWVGFSFDTASLAGRTGALKARISSARGDRRMYCFEATTR